MLKENEAFSPSPKSAEILRQAAESICPDDEHLKDWFSFYVQSQSTRLAFDLDIVRKEADKGLKILECGAIPLLLTVALKECGYAISSLDIAPERFAATIRRFDLDVRKCNFETESIPFDDSQFDVVVFNELFEHLRINPIFTLREVRRVLKPGGILMLSTPNLRSVGGIRNFLFDNLSYSCAGDVYHEYEKLENLGHMGHVREYTTREMVTFLEKIGFQVVKIIRRGDYGTRGAQMIIRVLPSLRPFFSLVAKKI